MRHLGLALFDYRTCELIKLHCIDGVAEATTPLRGAKPRHDLVGAWRRADKETTYTQVFCRNNKLRGECQRFLA